MYELFFFSGSPAEGSLDFHEVRFCIQSLALTPRQGSDACATCGLQNAPDAFGLERPPRTKQATSLASGFQHRQKQPLAARLASEALGEELFTINPQKRYREAL